MKNKPTIKEIADYCEERGNDIDAELFFHHYESIGWIRVIGKKEIKIKSWKSVVVTWEKRNNNSTKEKSQYEKDVEAGL